MFKWHYIWPVDSQGNYYLRQGGNVFAGFRLSVCLSVC